MEFETVERCGRIHIIKNGVESAGFIKRDRGGSWGWWDFVLVTVGSADEGLAHIAASMDTWYAVAEAAQRLLELGKCATPPHPKTVCRWARAGRFPGAVRAGRGRGGGWRLSEKSLRGFRKGGEKECG